MKNVEHEINEKNQTENLEKIYVSETMHFEPLDYFIKEMRDCDSNETMAM
jgi:hypothetical protein